MALALLAWLYRYAVERICGTDDQQAASYRGVDDMLYGRDQP